MSKRRVRPNIGYQENVAEAKTTLKNSSAYDDHLEKFLFKHVAENLKEFPFIINVQLLNDSTKEVKKEEESYWDYVKHIRSSHAFISIQTPRGPVRLLMKVKESYRKCSPPKDNDLATEADDEDYYGDYYEPAAQSSSSCSREADVKISGPIAIYGNYVTSVDLNRVVKDQVTSHMDTQ